LSTLPAQLSKNVLYKRPDINIGIQCCSIIIARIISI
jgi:hypothetical protein